MCTEETIWDREMNLGVHHNGEWRDLLLFALSRSDRIERTKERIFVCRKHVRSDGGQCYGQWY